MALSIMLYHFSGQHDAATPLGRLGVYGVSIFFILSGLSMAIAYDRYVMDFRSSVTFFIRRMFRIWPLFQHICSEKVLMDKTRTALRLSFLI
jgi:peptidoglycan/LPS O-acetylase OafA/YrhL